MTITEQLLALQDLDYKAFQAKLMPTIAPETIIGVRTPLLRELAKRLKGTPEAEVFLKQLPHQYYEENNLHAFLIEGLKDFGTCIHVLDRFLPFVDNWATCDSMNPKVLKKQPEALEKQIRLWMDSKETYTVRFGIKMLMSHFLDEHFSPVYLEQVASVKSDEYYVKMMVAWYFATALSKQYDATLPFIEQHRLEPWTHRKAIQKAIESYRITDEQKQYLRNLK